MKPRKLLFEMSVDATCTQQIMRLSQSSDAVVVAAFDVEPAPLRFEV